MQESPRPILNMSVTSLMAPRSALGFWAASADGAVLIHVERRTPQTRLH